MKGIDRACLECKTDIDTFCKNAFTTPRALGELYILCSDKCGGFICKACLRDHLAFHALKGELNLVHDLGMPEGWVERMLPEWKAN